MFKVNLLDKIKKAIIEMDEDEIDKLCNEALNNDISANDIMKQGLMAGMDEVESMFEREEYFLPEVLMCLDTFNKGIEVVKPYIIKYEDQNNIKIVIGVVEGDSHDIGKNIVKIMMQSRGIEVYDLGRDVPLHQFIDKAEEIEAHAIGMSTLMTTTMEGMKAVIDKLEENGIRHKYKVMIGGAPVSERYAKSIGADIYTKDANQAAKKLISILN